MPKLPDYAAQYGGTRVELFINEKNKTATVRVKFAEYATHKEHLAQKHAEFIKDEMNSIGLTLYGKFQGH
jgi:hypothetical protein